MASAKLSPRDVRRARDLAEWVLTESPKDGLDLDFARGEARHLLLALTPRRRPRREQRAPGASVEQRRDERRKRMADLREAVMVRAGGVCELCGSTEGIEIHHLIPGGLRRHREREDTLIALCKPEHLAFHRGGPFVLSQVVAYCRAMGMTEAAAAVEKRLAKVEEARSSERAGGERP